MNGLIIKKQHLDKILIGEKTWEIRGSRTKVRGRIALIESGSGLIVGEAFLVDAIGPLSKSQLLANISKHLISKEAIRRGIRYRAPHAWVLTKVRRYRQPISYNHPTGAVIWVKNVA